MSFFVLFLRNYDLDLSISDSRFNTFYLCNLVSREMIDFFLFRTVLLRVANN